MSLNAQNNVVTLLAMTFSLFPKGLHILKHVQDITVTMTDTLPDIWGEAIVSHKSIVCFYCF